MSKIGVSGGGGTPLPKALWRNNVFPGVRNKSVKIVRRSPTVRCTPKAPSCPPPTVQCTPSAPTCAATNRAVPPRSVQLTPPTVWCTPNAPSYPQLPRDALLCAL
eukprot:gene9228-biopygen9482